MISNAIHRLASTGAANLKRGDCDLLGADKFEDLEATVEGSAVSDLQTVLRGLGVQIEKTGHFGANTQEALLQLIGKVEYDLHRGDLALLSDVSVQQLIAARPDTDATSATAEPAQPEKEAEPVDELPEFEFPERFDESVKPLLAKEGGFVNDPTDRGGMTFMGIARLFWPDEPLWKRIDAILEAGDDPDQYIDETTPYVKEFYFRNFWEVEHCDVLFPGLDEQHLDFAVNAGGAATLAIQRLANAICQDDLGGKIDEDGKRGPTTRKAIEALGSVDPGLHATVLAGYKVLQGYHYLRVCAYKPAQGKFLKGWLLHRLEL